MILRFHRARKTVRAYLSVFFVFFQLIALLSVRGEILLTNYSAAHPVKIMAIGDSITDDCVLNGAWRSYLQTLLDASGYPFTFVGRNTSNPTGGFTKTAHEGYCGAVIAPPGVTSAVHGYAGTNVDLETIVPEALAANTPDVVLLLIGANDIGRGRDPYQTTNDLSHLLDTILSNAPNANIITARITSLRNAVVGGLNYGAFFANVYLYNAALQALVNQRRAAGQNIFLADMFSVVDPNTMFNSDHLHPNALGLAAIAQEWFTQIQAITLTPAQVATRLMPGGSVWKYNDTGQDLGTNWTQIGFDDSGWSNGVGRLGFGDATDATTVGFGTNKSSKNITTYFRTSFVVPAGVIITNLQFRLLRVHGAVIWLNGQEALRSNMTNGPIAFTNLSLTSVGLDPAATYYPTNVAVKLGAGTNLLAVEIHLRTAMQATMGFDLALLGTGYRLPALSIGSSGGNVLLDWSATNAAGYSLYQTTNLSTSTGWTNAGIPTQTNAGQVTATVPLDGSARFFRLQHP